MAEGTVPLEGYDAVGDDELEDEIPGGTAGDGDQQDEGATAEEEEGTVQPGGKPADKQVDWEARFKGLQKTVQQLAEQNKTLAEKLAQDDEAKFLASLEEMTPEERQHAIEDRKRDQTIRQLEARVAELKPYADKGAKEDALEALSEHFGVKKAFLQDFLKKHPELDNPQSLVGAAVAASELAKATARENRDPMARRVESGSSIGALGVNEQLQSLSGTGDIMSWMGVTEKYRAQKRR